MIPFNCCFACRVPTSWRSQMCNNLKILCGEYHHLFWKCSSISIVLCIRFSSSMTICWGCLDKVYLVLLYVMLYKDKDLWSWKTNLRGKNSSFVQGRKRKKARWVGPIYCWFCCKIKQSWKSFPIKNDPGSYLQPSA